MSIHYLWYAYNHFHAIFAIFLQEKLGKASGTIALLCTAFFIESDREYDSPAGFEITLEKTIDGCQHGNEVGLIILRPTSPNVLAIIVTIKWRMCPFSRRRSPSWDNLE